MLKKFTAAKAVVMSSLLMAAVAAQAALPTGIDTAMAAVETDAKALMDIVTPIVVSILGMIIVIKLIKRFGNKI